MRFDSKFLIDLLNALEKVDEGNALEISKKDGKFEISCHPEGAFSKEIVKTSHQPIKQEPGLFKGKGEQPSQGSPAPVIDLISPSGAAAASAVDLTSTGSSEKESHDSDDDDVGPLPKCV